MKLTGFEQLLSDVRRLERTLDSPTPFYAEREADYLRQAHDIASQVLRLQRPADTRVEDWNKRIDRTAARLTSYLTILPTGLFLGFKPAAASANREVLQARATVPNSQFLNFDDIKEWIRAGIRGEPGGKRITHEDDQEMSEKGIDGVALKVIQAAFSSRPDPRYVRLRRAIQRYFLGRDETQGDSLLDAVLQAWIEHFTPVLERDLTRYRDQLCREF